MRIQIISRYVPSPNRSGPFTYLFDLMRYLSSQKFTLELIVLDPWFEEHRLHPAVNSMATVSIMRLEPPDAFRRTLSLKSLLRPFYKRLPVRAISPIRALWYHMRKQSIPVVRQHDAPATPEEIAFVHQRVAASQPHIILANHTCLGNLFDDQSLSHERLTAILTHHIESQRTSNFQRARLSVTHDSAWNVERERILLQHADLLVAIQRDDAEILHRMAPQTEIVVAPMSAKLSVSEEIEQSPGRCLFVGSDIDHNVHGMNWFLEQIWPRVYAKVPQTALHVCGTVCSKIENTYPNVKLLGRVENLDGEYAAAQVCLIPLVVGSGLKIKLVEALSHGRACVSTSVGVQGVQDLANKAVLVADSPKEFADSVITILRDSETRKHMEEEARRYVTERLSPEKAYQPFVDRIHEHILRQQAHKNL